MPIKNMQLWPHLPCLPFSGEAKKTLFTDFPFTKKSYLHYWQPFNTDVLCNQSNTLVLVERAII